VRLVGLPGYIQVKVAIHAKPSKENRSFVHPSTKLKFNILVLSDFRRDSEFNVRCFVCLFLARQPPQLARTPSFMMFLDHTQRRTTVGRNHLDE
jgi:hypothetical protein